MTNLKNHSPCFVYGIFDPRTATFFYVGVSIHPENRLPQHRCNGSPAYGRCSAIKCAGFEPQLIILQKCVDRNQALRVEHRLLNEYPALTNRTRDLYQITGKYVGRGK